MSSLSVSALPASHYAQSSRLSDGRWGKIEVLESGIQFISNATLRNLGFSDPSKVNVYGYGGRMLPERLDAAQPDDLPIVPSIHTSRGIIFFGHSNVTWNQDPSALSLYKHHISPYSDKSCYFVSDSENGVPELTRVSSPESAQLPVIDSFTERIHHEQDLLAPGNSGRLLLGEDFRTQSSRNFSFQLPGNLGDAVMKVCFGAKVSNGTASIVATANGQILPAIQTDLIPGISSAETFLNITNTEKIISSPGSKLDLNLRFHHSGALFTAALDHIEIEYQRELRLFDNELYFYLNPKENSSVRVEGCDKNTVIWDVTDPLRPQEITFSLEGDIASFTSGVGYQEFVAFNPEKVSRAARPVSKVSNQDIHGMDAPDMLVIAPEAYIREARRIADLHAKTDGLRVEVLTPEMIYNEFSSGNPDVTAFRKLLKMWKDRAGAGGRYARYCLIMGRASYDNKMVTQAVKRTGYPRVPIWQSPSGLSESTSYSTDDYIGMLDDTLSDTDMANAEIHVAVGRMPVKSQAEASAAVDKLEKYILEPDLGQWRNNVMVIADDQDNGEHLSQAETVIDALRKSGNGESFLYEKLYLDAFPLRNTGTGPAYPEAKQRMLSKLDEGVLFLNYIGHANSKEWGHEKLLTKNDIASLKNKRLPFIYASTCEFLQWDADEVSAGEEMWLRQNSGAIGMICPSRKVFISLNGTLNANTAPFVFMKDHEGKPMRVGDIMVQGKNSTSGDSNKLRYALMGDPAMRLPSPALRASLDSINGIAVGDNEDFPVLKARSRVKIAGSVTTPDSGTAGNFNGTIDFSLFDAEKVVETFGNGENGKEMTYNDRKSRLSVGKAIVKDGKWEAELLVPADIENNFSPALLSLYALADDGTEANGSNESFYLYGMEESSSDDYEGPAITEFYLNSPSFKEGDAVGHSSTLYATLHDPSGINLSETGIGHRLTVGIDDSIILDDASLYFTPDTGNAESGKLAYPLSGIAPGEHNLTLTAWDLEGNSSSASMRFNIRADWQPSITELYPDVNPATSSVNFTLAADGLEDAAGCRMDIYDLAGRKVWSNMANPYGSRINMEWDLTGFSGNRVERGIYIYRATIITSGGSEISRSGKLAVTAP